MFSLIREILSYPFLARAIVSGVLIALCSALLGVSLVLKRYAMIGDGLSHVSFGALAFAMAVGWAPMTFSIPLVLLASFLLLRLSDKSSIRGDSALAMISSSALAIGVIAVSWGRGMTTDVCNYMFGTILATSIEDVKLTVLLSSLVIVIFIFFYQRLFAITFDENFARASGSPAGFYNMLLAALTSVTIVIGMRMMGALLISSLIIFPGLSSMRVFKSFKSVIISSSIISVLAFALGFIASYVLKTPSGASIVIVNLIFFIIFALTGKLLPYLKSPKITKVIMKGSSLKILLIVCLSSALFCPLLSSCKAREDSSLRRQMEAEQAILDQKAKPEAEQAGDSSGQKQSYDELIDLVENPTEAPELQTFEPQKLPEIKEGEELFIDEKMYLGWVLDIYTNLENYLGKTVRIRGMFESYKIWSEDHYVVYRFGPGCCGNDAGMCGFEITLPEGVELDSNQWIEVEGVFERYEGPDGMLYLRINSSSVRPLEEPENPYTYHY